MSYWIGLAIGVFIGIWACLVIIPLIKMILGKEKK